jgi:hypothetical protein
LIYTLAGRLLSEKAPRFLSLRRLGFTSMIAGPSGSNNQIPEGVQTLGFDGEERNSRSLAYDLLSSGWLVTQGSWIDEHQFYSLSIQYEFIIIRSAY